ncbi:unnamed protein product [Peniophora sp. CBMAI 1063]|nr:unnamed protein product [Peniophora sp. CBMAI 1063]
MDESQVPRIARAGMHSTDDAQEFWSRCYETRLTRVDSTQGTGDGSSIQAFDVEINAAMNAVSALRYRRNRLLPIFRLPPELLLRIMQECSGFHPTCSIISLSKSWVAHTHVCKTFRDLAIGCQALWTNINTQLGFSWTEEMLKRSKGTIHGLHLEFLSQDHLADVLQPHMITLQHLSVKTACPTDSDALTRLLACPAPELQEAILVGCERPESGPPSVPAIIHNAARLRDLNIVNFDLLWKPAVWPNLRSLKVDLSWLEDGGSFTESFTDIVNCLRASPSLECLEFRDCLLPRPHHEDPLHKVRLPRLSDLTMCCAADSCLDTLEVIEAPHLTELHIKLTYSARDAPMTDSHAERLATFLRMYRSPVHTAYTTPTRDGIEIYAYRQSMQTEHDDYGRPVPENRSSPFGPPSRSINSPNLSVILDFRVAPDRMALIVGALPLENLRSLSISLENQYYSDNSWGRLTWHNILARARRLHTLRVCRSQYGNENIPALCRLLATPRADNRDDAVYLPSLNKLTLKRVRMGVEFMGTVFYRKLLQFLHRRAQLGAGIHILRLASCSGAARLLEPCFLRIPGLAVEYTGFETYDARLNIGEGEVEACMDIGPEHPADEEVQYEW